jgi:hypothetical protein
MTKEKITRFIKLLPFSASLLKLHLNHTAILTPNPSHLGDWTFMGVFGVVAGFFLADRTAKPSCKMHVRLIHLT